MDTTEMIRYLYENPESWPTRMAVIEDLVRHGEIDRAKALVPGLPRMTFPMPPDYPQRIHTLFTQGIDSYDSLTEESPQPPPAPVEEEKMEALPEAKSPFGDEFGPERNFLARSQVPLFDEIKPERLSMLPGSNPLRRPCFSSITSRWMPPMLSLSGPSE